MRLGFEIFYETPGAVKEKCCRVCGSECEVKRGGYGPSSFMEAVSKIGDFYDVFSCPHVSEDWHQHALKLVIAIDETPSKRLADLMKLDLEDLLKENETQ